MRKLIVVCAVMLAFATLVEPTHAQVVVYPAAPVTTVYSPVVPGAVAAPLPNTVYSPVAPAMAPMAAPMVPAPAVVAPTIAYYYPAPRIAYRPVIAAPTVVGYAPAAVPAVVAARPIIVRPKIYVPGQPIRNVFRAITP